jgi:hypothetical protein
MDDTRTLKIVLVWKPIGMKIRGRPTKRWIEGIEEDGRERSVKKEQNGRESLRRPKPTVGCNARRRRLSYATALIE